MNLYYTRDLQPVKSFIEAFNEDKKVAKTNLGNGIRVSTVFLCINHNFSGVGDPILFETMVFGGPLDEETERYCTEDEALKGHERMVQRVRKEMETNR